MTRLTKKTDANDNILNKNPFSYHGITFINRQKLLLLAMANYTNEDLIQYLYHETAEEKTKAIEKALETDWILKEEFDALKVSQQGLDKLVSSPRQQSIMAILNYAKTSAEIEQP